MRLGSSGSRKIVQGAVVGRGPVAAVSSAGTALRDSTEFRDAMGRVPTGVTVVTAWDPSGAPCGLTVNSFTSVSLDPALVLVCIDRSAASHGVLLAAGSFVVNVLAREQADLAERFARDPADTRFEGLSWTASDAAPVLEDTVGWLSCGVIQTHEAGDHTILVGRVEQTAFTDRDPLVFHRGGWSGVAPP